MNNEMKVESSPQDSPRAIRWFCSLCWRNGEVICADSIALAEAKKLHRVMSKTDATSPTKTPTGSALPRSMPIETFKTPPCAGSISLGEKPNSARIKRDKPPRIPYPDEGIKL